MTAHAFLDTNVLIYAVSKNPAEAAKMHVARELLNRSDVGLSAQVLQEFYVTATQKIERPISHEEAREILAALTRFPIQPVTTELVFQALELKQRHQLSYWDAAIVAAAQGLKAKVLYSEDFSRGQRFGDLVVENPFV